MHGFTFVFIPSVKHPGFQLTAHPRTHQCHVMLKLPTAASRVQYNLSYRDKYLKVSRLPLSPLIYFVYVLIYACTLIYRGNTLRVITRTEMDLVQ
jgi:hypothetical protein